MAKTPTRKTKKQPIKKTPQKPAHSKPTAPKPVQTAAPLFCVTPDSKHPFWRCPIMMAISIALLIIFIFLTIDFLPQARSYFSKRAADDRVVATVDGEDIYLSDVKRFAEGVPQLAAVPFDAIYPRLLDTMINTRIMFVAAKKAGVSKDPEVKRDMRLAREQIFSQAYISKELEKLMTEQKLKDIYVQEIRNFPKQDEIKARHILLSSKDDAEEAIQELKAGKDFAALADEESISPEKNGGDLGYFTQNMMIPEFSEAVFKMKKGQISAPIKTSFGWHVVLVEDRRPASPPSFDAVKEELKQIFASANVQTILDNERAKQKVEIKVPSL